MRIDNRSIGGDAPTFVIAEVGVNHNGDPELAHQLIDVAATSGADGVKFQTFDPEALVSARARTAAYQRDATGTPDQLGMLQSLELPRTAWPELLAHAAERSIAFLSTPFDLASLEFLAELGVPAIKIASGDLTYAALLQAARATGVPLLVSTGMSNLAEVRAAVEVVGTQDLCLLHCVSAYPAPPSEANLRAIGTLADRFGVPVGWSDHTTDALTAIVAVALGATVLEKHITLDRGMEGPDHRASMGPEGFKTYVASVRTAATALGDGVKTPVPSEGGNIEAVRRSWHVTRDLPQGHELTNDDVIALRPAVGVSPMNRVVGRRLTRPLAAGSPLLPNALEAAQ